MPTVTITLTDTPTGGVAIHTDFKPAIGAPCSAAQSAALDIITTTKRQWATASEKFGVEEIAKFFEVRMNHINQGEA
ncbi:MAG: hypothetical protein CK604_00690 [Curvibacter sp. PD_MW3]|nr:MAG: hypothetical protein CK604_00690 [Curvibacter sp. PD_MW3]